jgi:hypothetical protein
MKKPRDYRKATAYEEQPEQVRHREERNRARALVAAKTGRKAISGRDIAHIESLGKGGSNAPTNLRAEAVRKNRSWRKGQKGYNVPIDK